MHARPQDHEMDTKHEGNDHDSFASLSSYKHSEKLIFARRKKFRDLLKWQLSEEDQRLIKNKDARNLPTKKKVYRKRLMKNIQQKANRRDVQHRGVDQAGFTWNGGAWRRPSDKAKLPGTVCGANN